MTARPDKATGGRTGAAAVDQAIADVRERIVYTHYCGTKIRDGAVVYLDHLSGAVDEALAALRVLADAVEELRAYCESQDWHTEWHAPLKRRAEAAEAERDQYKQDRDEYDALLGRKMAERDAALDREAGTSDALDEMRRENVRLARQVADLEKVLRDGERIASRYLDTGRGDLDGWVYCARSLAAARSRDPQEGA